VILKSLLFGGLGVNAALGVVLLAVIIVQAPYFRLQHVEVTGNRHLSEDDVVEISGLKPGINLLTVDLGAVVDRTRRQPWIRSASVYRRLPGRIVIEVEERVPRAILAAGSLYYVDDQAEVFTKALPGCSVEYPLLTGVSADDLKANGPEVRELVRNGLELVRILEQTATDLNPAAISEIRVDIYSGLSIVTSAGRTVVMGKDNFEDKLARYSRLKRFLTRRGEWNNARMIDLDFEDRALVRSGRVAIQG
jgi:cell division protein FtsQ